MLLILALASSIACTPSSMVGPLTHAQEERDHLLLRARAVGTPDKIIEDVDPPLTDYEQSLARVQDRHCQSSYVWKNALTWTGSVMVAIAAGVTVGGAYATGNNDLTGKVIFGVSAGTLAALGSGFVAIGGILSGRSSDQGCVTRIAHR